MPITESDVGITEFLSYHRPFRAILKQRINDFVVNEVTRSGKIAKLTRLAQFQSKPSPREHETTAADNAGNQSTQPAFEALEACFEEPQRASISDLIRKAIDSQESEVVLPICTDKQRRTAMHVWVRNNIPQYITDTVTREVDDTQGQAVRLRLKKSCRPWKRRRTDSLFNTDAVDAATYDPREGKHLPHKHREWREDAPPQVTRQTYVQFVLWKRNKDTMDALNTLSKILRVPSSAFAYAGTKDKRAVTTQLVQVRGVSESRFAHANRTITRRERGGRSIAVGDVEILPKETKGSLGLGDLKGNRFTLALRDLDLATEDDRTNVQAAVESVRKHGFVNYFGLQRFGSGVSGTHETGFAFLRGDFEDVCRRILLPLRLNEWDENGRDGIRPERRQMNDALEKFGKREISAKDLLRVLPKWMHIETAIVSSFVHDEDHERDRYDYRAAFDKLPRNLRRMYGHAVQSYLWNVIASERIRMCRPDEQSRMHAIKGDIVLMNPEEKGEMNFETAVRVVSEEEERQKSVSVFQVLIPVLGSEVSLSHGMPYAERVQGMMEEQKIDLANRLTSDYGMKGTYRPLLSQPEDVEMEIVSYSSSSDVLIEPYVPTLLGKNRGETFESEIDILNGEKQNTDDTQTAKEKKTRTAADDNRNSNTSAAQRDVISDGRVSSPLSHEDSQQLGVDTQGAGIPEEPKKALIIAFTLGRGEFATMLIRELTGQNSSTANQKALQKAIREDERG
ncbi:unnamed protein product [Chondrus crispus]|uniref:TRUD domain-containing protein n=1 Tax=Chondrus crispus TaxID=2769 RepID=R7QPW3_CHOCR|nr:unnamed protein product [Chondrus crispus]CDF39430.1 unnamed protein product [Chondrus crispus]|eukprot:XP_005719341.1 unnamed protein product [Chondrus crispus]